MTDMFASLICRPPRHTYAISELGPARFRMEGNLYCREDVQLKNSRGQTLQCSHYHRENDEETGSQQEPCPCVIYLHGNCGSRVDADEVVEGLLDRGLAVFSLDFAGCGLSDGEYVSLGFHEQDDLISALKYLQQDPMTTSVGVWGRSMGSVAALMVGGSATYKNSLGCLVLDSPYASLRSLLDDLAHKYVPKVALVPYDVVVEATVQALRDDVRRRAHYDLLAVDALTPAGECSAPALFAHSKQDYLVPIQHSRRLVERFGGDAELMELEGDHNSARDLRFLDSVYDFLARSLALAPPLQVPPPPPPQLRVCAAPAGECGRRLRGRGVGGRRRARRGGGRGGRGGRR